ncbi:MAG: hypothetical protein IPJ65_25660 [Archangiaceae bacterium]|nr:hypothetical protein [Archangiaceae bacterium]
MRAGSLLLLSVWACACASQQRLPPGNELENAESGEGAEPSTVGQSKMPSQSAELARAFDPPPPTEKQKPAAAPSAPAAPVEPDATAQERADFQTRLDETKRQVARQDFETAGPALDVLEHDAEKLGPVELQAVLELEVKLNLAQKEWRGVRKAAERWLEACGPDRIDACRGKAIAALNKVAYAKSPEAEKAKARATAAKTADRCVIDAENALRAHAGLPGCLEAAAAHYRGQSDRLMGARVALAKAAAAAHDDKKKERASELYQFAARVCDEPRCAQVKRRALKAAGWLELQTGDPATAARLMIEEMGIGAERLPAEKKRYARTTEVDKVCAALDSRDGAGACRKLEKQVLGDYIFKDFSAQKAGVGLGADTVRTVNEHYNVSLQECLAAEAARLVPPAYETYQVQWMVHNDGRVDDVHMARKDQDETELALCLRRVFPLWRYPRYDGEAQHIEQSFTVSAHQRGR